MSKTNGVSIGKMRWLIYLLGKLKIPLIGFLKPKLLVLDDENVIVKIKLSRRSKNHLNSMYFGALSVGADLAAGIHAFYFSKKINKNVSFAFKSVEGQFLKRADSDAFFKMSDGKVVEQIVNEAFESQTRINKFVNVQVLNSQKEIVALFKMEISVRVKA